MLMEGIESLFDSFFVVINTSRSFSAIQKTFGHCSIADFEVQNLGAWANFFFKFLTLTLTQKKVKKLNSSSGTNFRRRFTAVLNT